MAATAILPPASVPGMDPNMLVQKRLAVLRALDPFEDIYPCSSTQRTLLQAQSKTSDIPQISVIHEILPQRYQPLDLDRLAQAWQTMVDRHQALRTIFIPGDGYNQGVLHRVRKDPLMFTIDNESGADHLRREPMTPYGIDEPRHRLLVCLTPSGRIFTRFDIHKALFDRDSMPVILRELSILYEGGMVPGPRPLYSDYINYLREQPSDRALSHWNSYLGGLEPCFFPSLTTNEITKGEQTLQSLTVEIPQFSELKALCVDRGLGLLDVLQTAWGLVLRSYTGAEDVCFGCVVPGRDIPVSGIKGAIGSFSNILVSRIRLLDELRLVDVLDSVQKEYLNGLAHQHSSLTDIYRTLNVSGPLFNTILSLQSELSEEGETSALAFQQISGYDPTEYDLTMNVAVAEQQAKAVLIFGSSILSGEQAEYVVDCFMTSVHAVLGQPECSLRHLNLIGDRTKDRLRVWNSDRPQHIQECLHDLFHRTALQYADAEAICSSEGSFTYRQLDELTTKFAHYLREQGVGAEVLVPVCFWKSPWTIISTLSILKAGGACVPLDPSHPTNRLHGFVEDSKARLILSASEHADRFAGVVERVIQVDRKFLDALPQKENPPQGVVTPDNAVFVVFTSGSTGRPKGIVLEHKGLCTMFTRNASVVQIGPQTRTLQYAAYSFDVSLAETYITLTHGGCICIPTEEERMNDVAGVMNRMRVNWTFLTPSVASLLQPSDVPLLKSLTLGGEAIGRDLHSRWAGCVRLVNSYGPAECSIWTSNQHLAPDSSPADIGGGVTCLLWVTEPSNHNKLVPIGCVGELVVQGPNVARGYLDREKTEAAYIENPVWLEDWDSGLPKRIYKTGDLVRHRGDGHLEFVGRKDTQVKLRGQRIELGEVEHAVRRNWNGAQDVVVEVVIPQGGKSKLLAAFISLGPNKSGEKQDLFIPPNDVFRQERARAESALREQLPPFMVPAIFIPIPQVPLTISRKTDRKGLRERLASLSRDELDAYAGAKVEKRKPVTEREKALQRVVAGALNLNLDAVSMDDDFFSLGGDSITAMKLVGMARKENISLSVGELVSHPRLTDLLAKIDGKKEKGTSKPKADMRPCSLFRVSDADTFIRQTIIPQVPLLDPSNVADVLSTTELQKYFLGPMCQYFKLHINGELDEKKLYAACDALVQRHSVLRTLFLMHNEKLIQVVLKKIKLPWLQYDCQSDLAEFASTLCQQDVVNPPPFGVLPLQFTLITLNEKEHTLIFRFTHALYDGVSLPILYRDLAALYEGAISPVITEFPAYIYQSNAERTDEAFGAWREILKESSMTQIGDPSRVVPDSPPMFHAMRILQGVTPPPGVTTATLVKAAWSLALSQHTGKKDVAFAQIVNGRGLSLPGVETIAGPCFNTTAVRVKHQVTWTGHDLLKEVQSQHMQTMSLDYLGFSDVVANSTSWPRDTKMASIILHQSHEQLAQFSIGTAQCTVEEFFVPRIPEEVVMYSIPAGDVWQLHLITGTPLLDPVEFDALLGKTEDFMRVLATEPSKHLTDLGQLPN